MGKDMPFTFSRKKCFLNEPRFPAQCKGDLYSSGMLCRADLYLVTETGRVCSHKQLCQLRCFNDYYWTTTCFVLYWPSAGCLQENLRSYYTYMYI